VAATPGKRAIGDPDLRDRLCELLEHDHLPYSLGSRFVRRHHRRRRAGGDPRCRNSTRA
jgi:hypothetical protein